MSNSLPCRTFRHRPAKGCILILLVMGFLSGSLEAQVFGPPPRITNQPLSQIVAAGVDVTFTVGVAASPTALSYQWRWAGQNMANETNSILVLKGVRTSQAGAYSVVVANISGPTTSQDAFLAIVEVLGQSSSPGGTITFKASSLGLPVPSDYQWHFNGAAIPGATNSSLSLTNVQILHAGNYSVVARNPFGAVTVPATLNIDPTFVKIMTDPAVSETLRSSGVVWGDFDGDGWQDLFIANDGGANNSLFHNNGDGTFSQIRSGQVVNDDGPSEGAVGGDYNNDGFLDLLVANATGTGAASMFLYQNQGDGSFTRVNSGPISTGTGDWFAPAWADYDNDGWLDLFVAAGNRHTVLFRNQAGVFARLNSSTVFQDNSSYAFATSAGDYDNDGFLDLLTANTGGPNLLYHNNADGTFQAITSSAVSTSAFGYGQGCAWGDYDNDGLLDLFVATAGRTNSLFHNNGGGSFSRVASGDIATDRSDSRGCAWGDYDNDGYLDLYVANGRTTDKLNYLYHNNGLGSFTRILTGSPANDLAQSVGCAWGDYDNDGFLDLYVTNGEEGAVQPNALYRNSGNSNQWINLKLVGALSNRSAIGAKVRLRAAISGKSFWQLREISGGTGNGSLNNLRASFGLGDAVVVETVVIEWPSGIVQELHNLAPNQFLTITESGVAISPRVQNLSAGSNQVFTAVTTLSGPLQYQWKFNGVALTEETNATLTIANAQPSSAGGYAVMVSKADGSAPVSSSAALLRLSGPPVITSQPQSQIVAAGTPVTFRVETVPTVTPLTYQWYKDGTAIEGANQSHITLPNPQFADGGNYSVTVTNSLGVANSAEAVLVVIRDLSVSMSLGASVTLRVQVAGPLAGIQWRFNGIEIQGATNTSFRITNSQPTNVGQYSAVVRTAFGSFTHFTTPLVIDPTFIKITTGPVVTETSTGGAGATWGDYDNDGLVDLFVGRSDGQVNRLYRNSGDGAFASVQNGATDNPLGDTRGTVWGDYNNDGNLDLFVTNWGEGDGVHRTSRLYHNNGDGTFTRLTNSVVGPIVTDTADMRGAAWGDFDNDGYLDIFVPHGEDRGRALYRNNGDGTFGSVATGDLATDRGYTIASSWGDYNNDGWLDLFVPNLNPRLGAASFLYLNRGEGSFQKITTGAIATDRSGSVGCAWGDYDNDGLLDLFVANDVSVQPSSPGPATGENRNFLYHNDGDGTFARITNSVSGPIVSDPATSWDCAWADYDNDGWLDLFVANADGPRNYLYHNKGDGTFERITTGSPANDRSAAGFGSSSCSWGDYDNDGFLDLFAGGNAKNDTTPQVNYLYRNNGNNNGWLKFRLLGTRSNRAGIGAKLRVQATIQGKRVRQMREASGGGGYRSQNGLLPHFGLGDASIVEVVRVEWPSGIVQELHNVTPKQSLTLTEPVLVIGPKSVDFAFGAEATFSVSTNNTGVTNYQWLFEGTVLDDQTNDTLVVRALSRSSVGRYGVVISLPDGTSVYSTAGVIKPPLPPTITQEPANVTIDPGADATFTVVAAGSPPLTYQWQLDGAALPGATNSTLLVTGAQPEHVGAYTVVVSNAGGSITSREAILTLVGAPQLSVLNDQSVSVGANVTFTTGVGGTFPFSFQWSRNGLEILGATNRALILTNVTVANAGQFSVFVKNALGSASSRSATLDVDTTFTKILGSPITRDAAGGGGASWGDYNDDGWLDLFVSRNDNDSALFINSGRGSFSKATLAQVGAILAPGETYISPVWADFDNDGNLDLFNVHNGNVAGANRLFRNQGDGTFKRLIRTEVGSMATDGGYSSTASWSDYDRDGLLDLAVSSWLGNPNYLYHNAGDGSFDKETNSVVTAPVVPRTAEQRGIAWGDFDNDGDDDLFGGGYGRPNSLFINNGDSTFSRSSLEILSPLPYKSWLATWADFDNDGFLDLFLPRSNEPGQPDAPNQLFRNNGDGSFSSLTNSLVSREPGKRVASYIGAWGDFDNDGFLDLYVANTAVDQVGQTLAGRASNSLYHNDGDGAFTKIIRGSPVNDLGGAYQACWGDYDNDGFLDLFVLSVNGVSRNLLYRNNGNSNGWLKLKLIGSASNRSAIGAKVRVHSTIRGQPMWQLRAVSGGSGFGSPNPLEPHFGLGDAANIDRVRIEWPSGVVQELQNVPPRQFLTVVEPPTLARAQPMADGSIQLDLIGAAGLPFQVEVSTNLLNWMPLVTMTNRTRIEKITDTSTTSSQARFYRAIGP